MIGRLTSRSSCTCLFAVERAYVCVVLLWQAIRHNPYRVALQLEIWCEKSMMKFQSRFRWCDKCTMNDVLVFQSQASCISRETQCLGRNQIVWEFWSRSLWFGCAWPPSAGFESVGLPLERWGLPTPPVLQKAVSVSRPGRSPPVLALSFRDRVFQSLASCPFIQTGCQGRNQIRWGCCPPVLQKTWAYAPGWVPFVQNGGVLVRAWRGVGASLTACHDGVQALGPFP